MGRERQKAKNRSSIARATKKPRSKKLLNHKTDPIIAAHWNPRQTPSQNFARLGLTTKLGRRPGGVVKTVLATPTSPPEPDDTQDDPDDAGYGEAIIVRDPDTGELSAIHPSDLDAEAGVFDSRLDQHNLPSSNSGKTSHEVVKQLEASAFAPRHKKKKPPQSTGEREWIERMVQKYGDGKDGSDSVRMMQRDKKLNVWQYSEGEIRRRLKRWQEGKAGPTDGNEELEGVEGDVG